MMSIEIAPIPDLEPKGIVMRQCQTKADYKSAMDAVTAALPHGKDFHVEVAVNGTRCVRHVKVRHVPATIKNLIRNIIYQKHLEKELEQ